ncbi:NTP pyrophosphohydrolase [Streptacidiphilus pinicola]|uniref:NTP pyrophosphohydrolase n=1 Tax=Streptacidiphilus pinicola TaxID=2219663 RepID=A0A2X0KF70_9ACTN|nr:NUDIX domain-containing protein [Streptacidiphilus pinicola]RAG87675.1 NTP pyrophosphohydrolase [Streptacidiphilus pinicola]
MSELVDRVDEEDRVLGVVERDEAIRQGWLHRVATTVCSAPDGRILVHRRPDDDRRFPGQLNWLLGGAANAGESYEEAAARELAEELGVRLRPRLVLTFRCAGVISPYWLGVHEVVVTGPIRPDPAEIAWHAWVTEAELAELVREEDFLPDGRDAYERYQAHGRA